MTTEQRHPCVHSRRDPDCIGCWEGDAARANDVLLRTQRALVNLLARCLEVEPDHLDPKDVMRFDSDAYDVLNGYWEGWR